MDILKAVWPDQADAILSEYDDVVLPDSGMVDDDDMTIEQHEAAGFMWDDIDQALNNIAPVGCYFGAHPGDGACLGFWRTESDYAEFEPDRADVTGNPEMDAYDTVWLSAVWDRPGDYAADVLAEMNRLLERGPIQARVPA